MPVTTVFADKGVYCRNGQNVPKKDDPAGIAGIGYWLFHTLLIHYPYLRVAWEWEDGCLLVAGCWLMGVGWGKKEKDKSKR